MASAATPFRFASRSAARVSAVSPDCVIAIASVLNRRTDRGSGTRSRSRPQPGNAPALRSGTCPPARSATTCRRRRIDAVDWRSAWYRGSFVQEDRGWTRRARPSTVSRSPRLLEDLLEHEVRIAGLLGHDGIPGDRELLVRPHRPCAIELQHRAGVTTAICGRSRNTTCRVWPGSRECRTRQRIRLRRGRPLSADHCERR